MDYSDLLVMLKDAGPAGSAVLVAFAYGQSGEAHHLAWVVDQMVRALLGDKYDEAIRAYTKPFPDGDLYSWTVGIAP